MGEVPLDFSDLAQKHRRKALQGKEGAKEGGGRRAEKEQGEKEQREKGKGMRRKGDGAEKEGSWEGGEDGD